MTSVEATVVLMFSGSALAGIALVAMVVWLGRKK